MSVVIVYKTPQGNTQSWVCDESKLDHILKICEAKELEILELDYLVGEQA